MRLVFLVLAAVGVCGATEAPPANANSRYTVEAVQFVPDLESKLNEDLRADVHALVGKNYDPAVAEELATRVRRDLRAKVVSHRIGKGDNPGSVRLYFDVQRRRIDQHADITRFAYHSKQGFTGGIEAPITHKQLRIGVGVRSDADSLLERAAGINANISRTIGDRVNIRFDHERLHQIWNRTTRLAAGSEPEITDIYRYRESYRPSLGIMVVPGLIYTIGVDLQHMDFQFPAARTEAANSVFNTLRLRRTWGPTGSLRHDVEAGYSLRAATRTLDSDFVYARHYADGRYTAELGDHHMTVRAGFGTMSGRAPLFERFTVGNSETVRGWNKFDIDPLGGSRIAYGSVEYRWDNFLVFYDVGTVWDNNEPRVARHGAGAGFGGAGFYLAVAFPLRSYGVQPVFLMGTTF